MNMLFAMSRCGQWFLALHILCNAVVMLWSVVLHVRRHMRCSAYALLSYVTIDASRSVPRQANAYPKTHAIAT